MFRTFLAWLILVPFVWRRSRVANDDRPPLRRDEAPELFAILDGLAQRACTRGPDIVYLTHGSETGVSVTGGVRTLSLSVALLAWATVDELRAVLAHEIGHFVVGDRRFEKVRARGEEVFGDSRGFLARLFLLVTRCECRRVELAADDLSGRLVGPEPNIRVLQRSSVRAVMFEKYFTTVLATSTAGVVPTDILAGFFAYVRYCEQRGVVRELEKELWSDALDPYAAHPPYAVRIGRLLNLPAPLRLEDSRPATLLVRVNLDAWLMERVEKIAELLSDEPIYARMTWAQLARERHTVDCLDDARDTAMAIADFYPAARSLSDMFAAVVRGPGIVSPEILTNLFRGALLERGATVHPELGQPGLAFCFRGEFVTPLWLVEDSYTHDAACRALEQWAALLSAPRYFADGPLPYFASFSSTIMSAMR